MTPLPATDAAYALFHEIAAWIDDVRSGDADFDDFADTVGGRLIPVADAARDEARAMGEKVARVEALMDKIPTFGGSDIEGWINLADLRRALHASPASPAPTKDPE